MNRAQARQARRATDLCGAPGISVWFTVFGHSTSDPAATSDDRPRLIARPSTCIVGASAWSLLGLFELQQR